MKADVMTLKETSQYLKISAFALGDIARARKIPCFKLGRMWRFRKSSIDRWMAKQDETRAA